MIPRRCRLGCALLVLATACASPAAPVTEPPARKLARAPSETAPPPEPPEARADEGEPEAPPSARLPEGVVPGALELVPEADGRRKLRVIHGAPTTRRAIAYFAGLCGNSRAPEAWAQVVSRYATLIVLQGDLHCPGQSGRYKWSQDLVALDRRIAAALRVVAERRGGALDTTAVAVMGYSQGATRAGQLAGRFPERYPWVIAAGIPERPRLDRLGAARAVAVLGGEQEPTQHMRDGVGDLTQAGKNVRFFLLPGAAHGQYGPRGSEVLDEAFRFVFGGG
jgi:hypothetical protein